MSEIAHLFASVEPFVRDYGVLAVFVILTLESLGAPVPGESLLIFAAIMAGRGEMSLTGLIVTAWAGSVLGDNIGYTIGRVLGRTAVLRYGARIGLTEDRFNALEVVFARYGPATVVFARFVNVLRQLNGIMAGILGMAWWRFLICNAIGAALWVLTWTLTTFYLSAHVADIARIAHHAGLVGAAIAVVALAVAVGYVWRRKRLGRS